MKNKRLNFKQFDKTLFAIEINVNCLHSQAHFGCFKLDVLMSLSNDDLFI